MKTSIRSFSLLTIALTVSVIFASDVSELLKSADEVLETVVEIRELKPREPIQKGIQSREEVRAYLVSRIQEEYPKDQIEVEERLLEKLGLIPPDLQLYEFMLELLTEQVAGYYDPDSKTFIIADWIPLEIQKPVMAHELTHALQDQYFDLKRFLTPVEGNDDTTLAHNALIEGEGFIIMLDYTLRPMGRSAADIPDLIELNRAQMPLMEAQFPIFGKAPDYLKETLIFPYAYGGAFIKRILEEGSWQDVDRVYSNLPESTEQILHPEKYLNSPDHPTEVDTETLQKKLSEDWEPVVENVLGEFSTYLLLKEYISDEQAQRASKGWDGDRVELWESERGNTALLLSTIWDGTADASEFFEAYSELVVKKYPQAERSDRQDSSAPQTRVWRNPGVEVTVTLEGDRVFVSEMET
ncbi:MAG TPA: hypothetical protein VMY18_04685 [Acidobacteriota bacterium]|nr:hypothetical protein [Acidobacteriota bacterium]